MARISNIGGGSSSGGTTNHAALTNLDYAHAGHTGFQPALGFTPENAANKSQANGYASLDGAGKVPATELPNSIMEYKGLWNATTNTPSLSNGTGDAGDVYRVSVAGTHDFGAGAIEFAVGDYAIYSGTVYEKSDATDAVMTVFGRNGNVTAQTNDYTWAQIDKTTSNISDIATKSHTSLSDVGTNTHAQIDTALTRLANTSGTNTGDQDLSGYATTGALSTHTGNTSNPHQVSLEQARTKDARMTGQVNLANDQSFYFEGPDGGNGNSFKTGSDGNFLFDVGGNNSVKVKGGDSGGSEGFSYTNGSWVDVWRVNTSGVVKQNGEMRMKLLASTPSSPDSGYMSLYPKEDGKWYKLASDGTETEIGGGGNSLVVNELVNETPNGIITAFTVDNVFVAGSAMVYLNGQLMYQGDDYSETPASKTITFVDPPLTGDIVVVTYLMAAATYISPANNALVVNEPVNETPDGNITLFTVDNAYLAGTTQVYRDGQLMKPLEDYTEYNPTNKQISFTTAPVTGSAILVTYQTSAVFTSNGNADTLDGQHGPVGAIVGTSDTQALTNKDLTGAGNTFPASLATLTGTQTLTNKRITKRVTSVADSATPTPNADTTDVYLLTALAQAAAFGAPTGTPTEGQQLMIRVKDNGTARALTWNAIYRASSDLALPSTTVLSKVLYCGFVYNAVDSKWDLLAVLNNF